MYINKDSLIVNGVNLGKYITDANYGYFKIWGKDTGRTLSGVMSGSLIGIFPKITVNFAKLNQEKLNTIAPILDSERQTVQYYDPNKKRMVSMRTYTGDWEIKSIGVGKNEPFSCSFISVERRK